MKDAQMDAIYKGAGYGDVAKTLLASGMNPAALRTAGTLRKDEWKEMDEAIVAVARQRLVGVNDLVSRGLVLNISNGLGTTVLETERSGDMNDAQMDMAGDAVMAKDQQVFDIGYLPLPITHKDFEISVRRLNASRALGQSVDVSQSQLAMSLVAEKIETVLFQGASTYTFGGGTIYGYQDFPQRTTVSLALNWDASSCTGALIVADVIALKQASIADRHYGPWILYVPTAYEATLDDDFKANSDLTIRQRILQIAGIDDVKVADKLSADNVVLAEMAPESTRMVIGMQPTVVEWQSLGGMLFDFKVMAIMVPQLRADKNSRSGIVHLS